MMRLVVLESSKWKVTAVEYRGTDGDSGNHFSRSLNALGANYSKSIAGLLSLLGKVSTHGPSILNDELSHEVDKNESIYEIKKGDLRVLWFYGNGNKIIVCTHCFVKKGRKTPEAEKNIAISFKRQYFQLVDQGRAIILVDEKGNIIP